MLKKIIRTLPCPVWFPDPIGEMNSRWKRLYVYDLILDGKLYDHLPNAFYDEERMGGGYIPIAERRPSCQFRIARYVARWSSRKLFAGRHIPKIRAKDKSTENKINNILTGTKIWPIMSEAAYRGSVGSVAITFRVDGERVGLKIWRAAWCSPMFDDFGDLVNLRVHYVTSGVELNQIGIEVKYPERDYWFIRDYMSDAEVTYEPVLAEFWNPISGFIDKTEKLVEVERVEHNLGFVPAVWIANPGGTGHPDGAALWEDAIPDNIEIDYLLSQAARGSRYNCAPQLVVIGSVANSSMENGTNPTTTIFLEAAHKDSSSGEMIGAGDVKLLEMNGSGSEAALKIVEALKRMALEQIGVVQKDPKDMPGPLSGRAMEYLDEDAHDTAMQWRTTYGEGGVLALIAKILRVRAPEIDVSTLWLQWPRIYQPTPADLQSMIQALTMAIKPQAAGEANADGSVPVLQPLMDTNTAAEYLAANMDLGILDDTEGDAPIGPNGGVPDPKTDESSGGVQLMQYWRILPPVKVI